MKNNGYFLNWFFVFGFFLHGIFSGGCQPSTTLNVLDPEPLPADSFDVRVWKWNDVFIPPYTWPDGTPFGNGLYVDVAMDPNGVTIVGDLLRFYVDPVFPPPPPNAVSRNNYRSEIRTAPWNIEHPLGTEQWIGWRYQFGESYVIDPTSPITIYQNHPGVEELSPQFELEIAARNRPAPAKGGEIQVVNSANDDRIVYPVRPRAGETLDVVIHVIYGIHSAGLLQVWLNGTLFYDKAVSTVYREYSWGGNNKWGIYHHTFNESPADVQSSLAAGAGKVELFMGTLRLLTRTPHDPAYRTKAYHLVRPD